MRSVLACNAGIGCHLKSRPMPRLRALEIGRSAVKRTHTLHVGRGLALLAMIFLLLARCLQSQTNPPIVAPLVASSNVHYFKDANGHAVILTGSQSWNTFQDFGTDGKPQPLDFKAFVKFLAKHGQNFTLLWTVEMPKFCHHPNTVGPPPAFTVRPLPWERTGPARATDGGLKFNLTRFNQSFFDRLRARVQALDAAGVYAGVYLFTGEYLLKYRCSTDGYPLTGANNINGVDDGYVSGRTGTNAITMTAPNAITKVQDAYVKKVIDTLNDLPNVLWIVSEESSPDSTWWNGHMISLISAYESRKPYQHPVGYATLTGAPDAILYNSDADWVAPKARISPIWSCGSGKPACKVNINDSDHSYWEIWNDTPQQNRNWAWENFMNGNQVLFMDPYLVYYPRENRNPCVSPKHGICSAPDKRWDNLRNNLGYVLRYSRRFNLLHTYPQPGLSSTGYCLVEATPAGDKYLVYAPGGGLFRVNLSEMSNARTLAVEWFKPSIGAVIVRKPIRSGSSSEVFIPPFRGDAVLYLYPSGRLSAGRIH
jgi:hypothetical protein